MRACACVCAEADEFDAVCFNTYVHDGEEHVYTLASDMFDEFGSFANDDDGDGDTEAEEMTMSGSNNKSSSSSSSSSSGGQVAWRSNRPPLQQHAPTLSSIDEGADDHDDSCTRGDGDDGGAKLEDDESVGYATIRRLPRSACGATTTTASSDSAAGEGERGNRRTKGSVGRQRMGTMEFESRLQELAEEYLSTDDEDDDVGGGAVGKWAGHRQRGGDDDDEDDDVLGYAEGEEPVYAVVNRDGTISIDASAGAGARAPPPPSQPPQPPSLPQRQYVLTDQEKHSGEVNGPIRVTTGEAQEQRGEKGQEEGHEEEVEEVEEVVKQEPAWRTKGANSTAVAEGQAQDLAEMASTGRRRQLPSAPGRPSLNGAFKVCASCLCLVICGGEVTCWEWFFRFHRCCFPVPFPFFGIPVSHGSFWLFLALDGS